MPTKETSAIRDMLYPEIEKILNTQRGMSAYKKNISDFISMRTVDIYDNIPCARIYFREDDVKALFNSIGLDMSVATNALSNTYYDEITNFNPKAAKDEFTVTLLSIIRYFYMKKMKKDMEISMIYLAFSGKFYPSIHYRSFPITPARHVMEYVVNNNLTQKFDIVSQKSLFGVMNSISNTWINTYGSRMKEYDDADVVYLVQQFHSRIGSFMKNLAEEYYKAYADKDSYMTYDSDNLSEDDYHLADNISLKIQRESEKAINSLNTSGVDYKICKMCSDSNIKPAEVQSIIESVLSTPENLGLVKEFINLLIVCYYTFNKGTDVRDVSFITYSAQAKPNAKQKEIVRQKDIIEIILSENSPSYLRRKSRLATANSYQRAIKMYFVLLIHNANR